MGVPRCKGRRFLIQYNNKKHKQMFDDFFEDSYHSYDKIYQHPEAHNFIYLGDMQAALDDDFLHCKNIGTVITAAKDMDHIVFNQTIQHIVYPLLDSKQETITHFFDSFFDIIEKNILQGSILVHCAAGISRSSTLVISYLMKKQKKTFKEAIAFVREGRPSVLPNLGFQRQLKNYELVLSKNPKKSRTSRRGEVKTSQSSKRPYVLKTQFFHHNDANKSVFNINVFPLNPKKFSQKYTRKQIQIMKVYSNNYGELRKNFRQRIKTRNFPTKTEEKTIRPDLQARAPISEQMNRNNLDCKNRIRTNVSKQQTDLFKRERNNRFLNRSNPKGLLNHFRQFQGI